MTANLRVTMIQADLAWHDPLANRRELAAHFRGLAGHTDLIVLPEMFTTGFSMDAAALAETDGRRDHRLAARGGRRRGMRDHGQPDRRRGRAASTTAWSGRRPTAGSRITTSATCSAWRASTSTTQPAASA